MIDLLRLLWYYCGIAALSSVCDVIIFFFVGFVGLSVVSGIPPPAIQTDKGHLTGGHLHADTHLSRTAG